MVQVDLLLKSLSALDCFKKITKVTEVTGGLSHPCFKVEADDMSYFAKMTSGEQLETELILAKIAAVNGLTPAIFFHDQQWLISRYIEGENLSIKKVPLLEKVITSVDLMIKFHQLTTTCPHQINVKTISTLSIIDIINDLLKPNSQNQPSSHVNRNPTLSAKITKFGREIALLITPNFAAEKSQTSNNIVCCHSDMNFSNVLSDDDYDDKYSDNKSAWLIDFEYACFAPAEFDLAMLIAINNIPKTLTSAIIDLYEQQASFSINRKQLQYFVLFCYLINGLWYYNQYQGSKGEKQLLTLAKQQWQKFDEMNASFKTLTESRLTSLIKYSQ